MLKSGVKKIQDRLLEKRHPYLSETVANPRFLPFSNSTSPHKSRVQIFQKVDLRHGLSVFL